MMWLALAWLRGRLQALVGFVARYPLQAALIGSLCLSAWLIHLNGVKSDRIDALKADIASIAAAQKAAGEKALAQKLAIEKHNKELADEADKTNADLRARYRAAVMRLAAAQGASRRADLPGQPETAQSPDGPGTGSQLLAVTEADALICADTVARLQAAREWALGL